ncbi:hypothetical protein [Streptomyces sp. Ac-502]|uniref:hypothetical protein n=1 Tax=Streptomyces sp. Ac-502 TaxID=3342801 RepID=UPI0038629DD4
MILASAGLARLGLSHRARQVFEVEELLPAVGAGVLSLECRRDDSAVAALLAQLNHEPTLTEATAERVMLQGLRGHCNSPIAGYCVTGPGGRSRCAAWSSPRTAPPSRRSICAATPRTTRRHSARTPPPNSSARVPAP